MFVWVLGLFVLFWLCLFGLGFVGLNLVVVVWWWFVLFWFFEFVVLVGLGLGGCVVCLLDFCLVGCCVGCFSFLVF